LTAAFPEVVLDLGTGDGRFVLATATAHPDVLTIGVDADAASMADASRRAARGVRRGGLVNALFVAAAAESLPLELDGIAASLTVHFPWGSLLRGLVSADSGILAGVTRVTRPGAHVTLLLSVTERDHVAGLDRLDAAAVERIACGYAAHGLALIDGRPATKAEVAASRSTWAARLGAGDRRPAWLLRFGREGSLPARARRPNAESHGDTVNLSGR
jgi:16S rRNA (adenine(1408)-N(1))-methyltransferase